MTMSASSLKANDVEKQWKDCRSTAQVPGNADESFDSLSALQYDKDHRSGPTGPLIRVQSAMRNHATSIPEGIKLLSAQSPQV